MAMNFENMVRCNNCMKSFHENEIVYNEAEDKEYCPHCGENGCLMDLTEEETEAETVMNHYDEGCKKWSELFAKVK